jgi:hypothetical protein
MILKQWVNEICYQGDKPQFLIKWTSVIFLLIFFMQKKDLLPVLDESDLIKVRDLFLKKQSVNFTAEQTKEFIF